MTTFFSGIADEHDLVVTGGYPGRLKDIFGIWVEESDALSPGVKNGFTWNGKHYPAELLCDIMHMEGCRPGQNMSQISIGVLWSLPATAWGMCVMAVKTL